VSGKYELVDGKYFRRKVRAIIVNGRGEFLLIRPLYFKEGAWTFVGGGVEDNESTEQAVLREVAEEVGIHRILSLKKSTSRHQFSFSESNRKKRGVEYEGQVADLFWVEVSSDIPVVLQAEEIQAYRWASLVELSQLVTVPAQLRMFESVLFEFSVNHRQENVA